MKCHYEILGICKNATAEEIKKAYRKLALEWHPDKNLHREEEAKETFQLLQQAYEILIDPQERAWYDRHREDILRGGFEKEYKDDSLDVYQYFNAGCFKGYGDDDKGFYTVYRHVFDKIAAEDEPFIEKRDIEVPTFGYSDSSHEEVVHNFYAYWQSYCTAKSFSWVDKCDLTEFRKANAGRQILRAAEKENKKLRDQHKKMRNEEVRQLVAFVRKRDKRVQAHKKFLEEQTAEKARKFQEQRKKQIEERQRNLEGYKEAEWSSMDQFEEHLNEMEAVLDNAFGTVSSNANDDEGSDQEQLDLYCVACDKEFRSEKSMKNHENSKKHKENVLFLKQTMEREELESLNLISSEDEDSNLCNGSREEKKDGISNVPQAVSKSVNKKKKKKERVTYEEEDIENELEDVQSKIDAVNISNSQEENVVETAPPSEPVNEDVSKTSKKKTAKTKDSKKKKETQPSTNVHSTEEHEKQSTVCEKCNSNFQTRNKLFQHLKESGHAMYLGEAKPSRTEKCADSKKVKGRKANR